MKIKIILFLLLSGLSFSSKAQTVTIPDSNFVNWLTIHIPTAMSGSQMDTSDLNVKTLANMYLGSDSIMDLTGVQYFKGLRVLDCSFNIVNHIPSLPDSLETFNCQRNQLDSLPVLPLFLTTLNCSSNPLDSLPFLPDSLTSLTCSNNNLSFLPILPVGLTMLDCSGNILTVLPVLSDSLTELSCNMNQLTALPALPDSLVRLMCSSNLITVLPALPSTLVFLDCSVNMLGTLPVLPSSLIELQCFSNQITVLPALPSALEILVCGNNLLPVLPSLPLSLLNLRCYNNQLPVLPSFPPMLNYLDCSFNLLPTLPAMTPSLSFINCSNNQIIVLPALVNGLNELICSSNQLTLLPVLPSTLFSLNCSANPLADLPVLNTGLSSLMCTYDGLDSIPALPSTLQSLQCNNNILQSLPVLNASLGHLDCSFNQIISLPALPSSLTTLQCNNNQIVSLPVLPANLNLLNCSNNLINCYSVFSHDLDWLYIHGNPATCLPNYIPTMDSLLLDYPLCIDGDFVNNPFACDAAQGILGFTYLDNNFNCSLDSADQNYVNIPVKLFDAVGALIGQTYTASNGVYNFSEAAGTYTVAVDTTNVPFIPQCSTPGVDTTVSIMATAPLVSNVNFDFGCKPGFDIGVRSVVPTGWVFPGQQHQLKVTAGDMSQWYNMHCAAGVAGEVKITVNGPVTFAGTTAGAVSPVVLGNTYTYSIADFGGIINTQAFGLLFNTDTTALAGSSVCVNVSVTTPSGGDNDSSNNVNYFCYQVVNSHDPNLKEVFPGDVSPKYKEWLTYTIHFQNTGSAPAFNIRVADTLDTNLDLSTFEVLNYSHMNNVTLNGNILTFRFPGIMLPDSTSDLAGSQGHVQYRIKIKHYLPIGTQIKNTAYIYFDYNEAVVTNTTSNEMINTVSVDENQSKPETMFKVYPNPASEVLYVNCNSSSKSVEIGIYDINGRLVMETMAAANQPQQLDIANLSAGLYVIRIKDEEKILYNKFIIQYH
jgi:fimbrial isopeptide formation D2 family protein